MSSQGIDAREFGLRLKEPCGWFAAGASFRRALRTLSNGAFRLFAYLCLEADRQTGCFEAAQGELANAIGKSRRIVGKYIEELEAINNPEDLSMGKRKIRFTREVYIEQEDFQENPQKKFFRLYPILG